MKRYDGDGITVVWDAGRCIHTGVCLRRLPSVFDVGARPWVDVTGADTDAIAATVQRCPTGALRYERDGAPEPAQQPTSMYAVPGGPLVVRGDLRISTGDGTVLEGERRTTLCRCGNSRNQPFCDNSHRRVPFAEEAPAAEPEQSAASAPDEVCPSQTFTLT